MTAEEIQWVLPPEPALARDPEDMIVAVLLDAQSYRLLAQQAFHALRGLTRQLDCLREQQSRLLDEYRSLREQTMRAAVA